MMSPAPNSEVKDIPFSDQDFERLAKLARSEFGLSLAASKKPLVYSRLSRRLKARSISDFPTYLGLLAEEGEEQERLELISALTTNVTSFFRENHHFETLRNDYLPEMIKNARSGGRLRIWSAGCSSGQEPYSISLTLSDAFPDWKQFDVRILATDIDPKIVERAKKGVYSPDEANGLAPETRRKLFGDGGSGSLAIQPAIRAPITFAELNLMRTWPFRGPFDAIFCRNVAIYFDQETQMTLWKRFADMLRPGGVLFIGHSERITGDALKSLSGCGITTYHKTA